jgi:hypothetical protein
MSEPTKTPGGAADLIADAIAEYELERIEALSPEELRHEMQREGRDPARADAVWARALAVLAETPGSGTGGSEEGGGTPERTNTAANTPGEPPPKVVDLAQARANRRRVTAGFLIVLAAMFLLWIGRRYNDDRVAGHRPRDDNEAAKLRKEALALCAKEQFAECETVLDEAVGLDPEGEADPEVRKARAAIRADKQRRAEAGAASP